MGKDAVNSMLEFFKGPPYGLSLVQLVVAFCAAFLAAEALCALCRYVIFRRPLRWSSHMLSLLIAAAFWSPLLVYALGGLENLAAYLDGKTYASLPIYQAFASLPITVFGAFLMGGPLSVLIIPILLFYLIWPNRLHSRKAIVAVVCIVIASMVGNYAWQIAISDGYSS